MQSRSILVLALLALVAATSARAQVPPQRSEGSANGATPAAAVTLPADYVIGPDDVLSILFWRDKELSADVVVRPDGNISLPLLNDIRATGYTPDELRAELVKAASKYIEDPAATVVVKEIRSRNVFIMGNIARPGKYPLTGALTVMQLIASAGGLQEYADSEKIIVMRTAGSKQEHLKFNYKDVLKGRKPEQNVVLVPGDTVVIP